MYFVFERCIELFSGGRSGPRMELWGNSNIKNVGEEAETAEIIRSSKCQEVTKEVKHL